MVHPSEFYYMFEMNFRSSFICCFSLAVSNKTLNCSLDRVLLLFDYLENKRAENFGKVVKKIIVTRIRMNSDQRATLKTCSSCTHLLENDFWS